MHETLPNHRWRHTRVYQLANPSVLGELKAALVAVIQHLSWRHHGIGALQAYLREGDETETRVHVWHPDLVVPGIEQSGQIHDHRFDMYSTVLHGSVIHTEHHADERPAGRWAMYEVINARKDQSTPPNQLPGFYEVDVSAGRIWADSRYFFERGAFHSTVVDGFAVTVITKKRQIAVRARLLGPKDGMVRHGFSHNAEIDRQKYIAMALDALSKDSP